MARRVELRKATQDYAEKLRRACETDQQAGLPTGRQSQDDEQRVEEKLDGDEGEDHKIAPSTSKTALRAQP